MDKRILRTLFAIGILFSVIVMTFSGCNKKDKEVVPNLDISNFSVMGGQIWGEFKVTNSSDVADKGIVIGLASGPSIDNNKNSTANISIVDDYYIFNDLQLSTTYYIKGYTKSKKGTVKYSDEKTFTTSCLEIDSIVPSNFNSSTTQISIYGRNFNSSAINNTVQFIGECVNGKTLVKGTATASSNLLTVDVTNVFVSSSCDAYVTVNNTSDTCSTGGSILTKIEKLNQSYIYHYSGDLQYTY